MVRGRQALTLLVVGLLVWLISGGGSLAQSGGGAYFDDVTANGDVDIYGTGVIRDTADQSVQAVVTSGGWNLIATAGGSPNIYGGVTGNSISSSTYGGFIGGGGTNTTGPWGAAPAFNVIGADSHFSTIGGGINNSIYQRYNTIGGGHSNIIDTAANYSVVAGGVSNWINGAYGTIAGGYDNTILTGQWSFIGGGSGNESSGSIATIAGGSGNYSAVGALTFVGGGRYNTVGSGNAARNTSYTITQTRELGYRFDHPSNYLYTLAGPSSGDYSVIAGGYMNGVGDPLSFVGGGKENWVSGYYSRIVSSGYDLIEDATGCLTSTTTIACTSRYNNIVGGKWNEINNAYVGQVDGLLHTYCNVDGFATIGGGYSNLITGTVAQGATVAGGVGNTITATYGTIGGGITNTVTGLYGAVPGGYQNTAAGEASWAGGTLATASHDRSFVWSGSAAGCGSLSAGGFRVCAETQLDDLVVTGTTLLDSAGITGALTVTGTAVFSDVTVSGTLTATGAQLTNATLTGTTTVSDVVIAGTLTFSDTVWDDLRVPAQSTRINPTQSKPDFQPFLGTVYTFLFDQNDVESVHFAAQLPHGWKVGTNLHPHVHWSPLTTGAGSVVWGLECTWSSIGGVFGAPQTVTVTATAPGTAFEHQMTDLAELDMSAADTVSTMVMCRFFRDGAHVTDTYAGDVAFLEVDFHYQIDAIGSREERSK